VQFSKKVLTNCGFKRIQRSKLIFDKYANHQYSSSKHTCPFCNQGDDTRAHLLNCRHESLVQLRELNEQQINRLPLPREYWEDPQITQLKGHEVRKLLLQHITIDDRSRIGLFTTAQVENICINLANNQMFKSAMKAVQRDFMDLLQITAKGVEQLIQCRNDKVYNQPKLVNEMTFKDKANSVRKNKFQPLEPDDLEEYQISTMQVLYRFPTELSFIENSIVEDEVAPVVTINGVLGNSNIIIQSLTLI